MLRNNIFYSRKTLYERPGVREKLFEQHEAIADAVVRGAPEAAEAAAADHIAYTFGQVESIQRDNIPHIEFDTVRFHPVGNTLQFLLILGVNMCPKLFARDCPEEFPIMLRLVRIE